jgi:hypothetical protein
MFDFTSNAQVLKKETQYSRLLLVCYFNPGQRQSLWYPLLGPFLPRLLPLRRTLRRLLLVSIQPPLISVLALLRRPLTCPVLLGDVVDTLAR